MKSKQAITEQNQKKKKKVLNTEIKIKQIFEFVFALYTFTLINLLAVNFTGLYAF